MIFRRVDENGRASLELANNDCAVDTNCARALQSVHHLTLPVSILAVKTASMSTSSSHLQFFCGIPQMGDVTQRHTT
jgi:hypothetical protein